MRAWGYGGFVVVPLMAVALGVVSTFVINEPISDKDGVTTMTLDGTVVTRQE